MICCCCFEDKCVNTFSCDHYICKECFESFVLTSWRKGCCTLNCPICRKIFDLSCSVNNDKIIFKYDTISFTISNSGFVSQVPSVKPWERVGNRLMRSYAVSVLPILSLKNSTLVDFC